MSTASIRRSETGIEHESLSRVLHSRLFANAPLLSSFLDYVCRRALDDGVARISEHEIGVNVFHRASDYDPSEDNIVRSYARQLRKRLEGYYETEGRDDSCRIDIPKGGYVPRFTMLPLPSSSPAPHNLPTQRKEEEIQDRKFVEDLERPRRGQLSITTFVLWTLLLCLVTYAATRYSDINRSRRVMGPLWSELFQRNQDTFLVPADAALVTMEEIEGRIFSLSEYESFYPNANPQPDLISTLKTRRFTSVIDLDIIASLERMPGIRLDRVVIRAARSLRIEDLSNNNAVLIGSINGMPWVQAFERDLNFHFIYRPTEKRAWIENARPQAGEATIFSSDWTGFTKKTYAVIAFVRNLNNTGHILLIQGLDGAGTEAASDLLFDSKKSNELFARAKGPDGKVGHFEALIEADAIENHPTTIRLVAMRTLP